MEAAVSDRDIRAALVQQQAELMRLMEQAHSCVFARGDGPKTHTQGNMDDQVAWLQHALDDVESALEQIDEHARNQRS
jgi:hypothetical protein